MDFHQACSSGGQQPAHTSSPRRKTRPVSYYAFQQEMAASKPTSPCCHEDLSNSSPLSCCGPSWVISHPSPDVSTRCSVIPCIASKLSRLPWFGRHITTAKNSYEPSHGHYLNNSFGENSYLHNFFWPPLSTAHQLLQHSPVRSFKLLLHFNLCKDSSHLVSGLTPRLFIYSNSSLSLRFPIRLTRHRMNRLTHYTTPQLLYACGFRFYFTPLLFRLSLTVPVTLSSDHYIFSTGGWPSSRQIRVPPYSRFREYHSGQF